MDWSEERFEAVSRRSHGLHGNRNLLPVAIAVTELDREITTAPEVAVELGGRIAPNRVLDALHRLASIGALAELPYPGRPRPRMFERRPSAYWAMAREVAESIFSEQLE
jgi:hypothetical protein